MTTETDASSGTAQTNRFTTFLIVWAGQSVSLIGSTLSGFALGIYVYRLTGSATTLGFVFALALLPSIIASPISGALVDRWGSRRALLVSNLGSMGVTAVLALLLITDTFAVWHVYFVVAAMSVLTSLEIPAFAALVPRLVPRRHLGRANGMRMFGLAASEVLAPVAGGFLLLTVGIYGIVLLDLLSFGLALVTLLAARLPNTPAEAADRTASTPAEPATRPGGVAALLAEFQVGLRYIGARQGLLALLLFFCAVNFSAGFIDLLISPLVLSFASAGTLGMVLSVGGVGMIIASLVVSAWGGPRRRVRGILVFSLVLAVATVVGAARPNAVLIAVAAFVFMGSLGVVLTTSQAIWQTKVEPALLGRVAAALNMVAAIPQVIAYALAGIAVDQVFEPLVGHDDVRSPALRMVVGDGPGRGIALLMMVMGVLLAISVAVAAANPRLRNLERELPDVAPEPDDNQAPAKDDPDQPARPERDAALSGREAS